MSDEQKEKDTSLKVKGETRNEVNAITAELNLGSQNEAVEHLLGLYRIDKEQKGPDRIPQLESLDFHFSRIKDIYVEMVMSGRDNETKANHEKLILDVDLQETRILLIKSDEEKKQLQTEVENANLVASQEIEKVRGEAALAIQNANKDIQQMQKLVTQAEESREQSTQLITLAQDAAKNAKEKADQFEDKANQRDQIQNENMVIKDELKKALEEIERIKLENVRALEKAELAHNNTLIKAEREYMESLNTSRELLSASTVENSNLRIQLGAKK
jgi:hypothetical protein